MNKRTDRLGNQFLQEISKLLRLEIKDPRIGFVTISRVEVTDDLSIAKVYTSVMGSDKEKKDSLIGLNKSSIFIRKLLFKSMTLRKMPKFQFVLDESLDYGFKVQGILDELKQSGELDIGTDKSTDKSDV